MHLVGFIIRSLINFEEWHWKFCTLHYTVHSLVMTWNQGSSRSPTCRNYIFWQISMNSLQKTFFSSWVVYETKHAEEREDQQTWHGILHFLQITDYTKISKGYRHYIWISEVGCLKYKRLFQSPKISWVWQPGCFIGKVQNSDNVIGFAAADCHRLGNRQRFRSTDIISKQTHT